MFLLHCAAPTSICTSLQRFDFYLYFAIHLILLINLQCIDVTSMFTSLHSSCFYQYHTAQLLLLFWLHSTVLLLLTANVPLLFLISWTVSTCFSTSLHRSNFYVYYTAHFILWWLLHCTALTDDYTSLHKFYLY